MWFKHAEREFFNLESSKILIVDGMALVRRIQLKNFNTFGDFAAAFFKRIKDLFLQPNVKRLDTVFERYYDISNKYLESTLRSKGKKIKNCILSNDNTKKQSNCNKFFSKIENKLQLVQFLLDMQT